MAVCYTVHSSGVFTVFIPEKTQKSRRLNSVIRLLFRGVNEAPGPWKDLLKLLKGRDPLCSVVDLGWYRDALPDDRRDRDDGARYRGLADPEDLGRRVQGGVRPVGKQEGQHPVAQVRREPAPGPDCAPAGPLESLHLFASG